MACQVRAARAMLRMSIRKLASQAEISESTIRRIEAATGVSTNVTVDTLFKLQRCFEEKGFAFSWVDGPTVTWLWRAYPGAKGRNALR